jgi:diguanylate cyclase (GGDEF)-like protein
MLAVEPLLLILGVGCFALLVTAALLAAALRGRGLLYGRLVVDRQRGAAEEAALDRPDLAANGVESSSTIRFLARDRRLDARGEMIARRYVRPSDDEELDEVLRGSFAATTFNHAVRVLTWSFILSVLAIVSASQLWQPVAPQIYISLTSAGVFVLVVHELMPAGRLGTIRVLIEGSAAVVFLTMLVVLTGNSESPFFFLYPLLIGGAALIAPPLVTLILTIETAVAYAIAAFSGPIPDEAAARETLARVGINLTALMLLSYAGIVISRVQKRTREAAVRLSTVDSLTDLHNRAYLFNAVEREIHRSHRFKRGFCLLMMDLDGLKSINDHHGHFQGDLVLRGVAQVIRASLRSVDTPARYGGDEFVALLPETDPTGAYVVAEKIRQEVSDLLVEAEGQKIVTSMSIGVVCYPDDGRTADELMIAADEAMYSSKRLGKNRVVGYADPGAASVSLGVLGVQSVEGFPSIEVSGFRPLPRDSRPADGAPAGTPGRDAGTADGAEAAHRAASGSSGDSGEGAGRQRSEERRRGGSDRRAGGGSRERGGSRDGEVW